MDTHPMSTLVTFYQHSFERSNRADIATYLEMYDWNKHDLLIEKPVNLLRH